MSGGLAEADIAAALDCLAGGWLTMGPRIAELEERFAARLGTAHAVAVSSASAALQLACMAVGARPGASVVVSALAGTEAVDGARAAGAGVQRADVIDASAPALEVEPAADDSTVAVVCSHLLGFPGDAAELAELCSSRGWALIEDVTAGLGARLSDGRAAGTAGAIGCFSLAAGGVIGVGEGGMIVTADEALAVRVRSLRSHAMTSVTWDRHRGHADTYDIVDIGFNYRLDEPRAAIAQSQLARLDERVAEQRAAFDAVRRLSAAPMLWDPDALRRSVPSVAPVWSQTATPGNALLPYARRWPDAFAGLPTARPAPVAEATRRGAHLIDLGAGPVLTPEG